MIKKIKKFL